MIGEALALVGALVVLLAALGVVRFDGALARMHALSKGSTLGIVLLLVGAAANLHDVNDITSVVLAGMLHLITSPPASNMVSRATYLSGAMRHDDDTVDEGAGPLDVRPADGPGHTGSERPDGTPGRFS